MAALHQEIARQAHRKIDAGRGPRQVVEREQAVVADHVAEVPRAAAARWDRARARRARPACTRPGSRPSGTARRVLSLRRRSAAPPGSRRPRGTRGDAADARSRCTPRRGIGTTPARAASPPATACRRLPPARSRWRRLPAWRSMTASASFNPPAPIRYASSSMSSTYSFGREAHDGVARHDVALRRVLPDDARSSPRSSGGRSAASRPPARRSSRRRR